MPAYRVNGYLVYSRSPYGALMYSRSTHDNTLTASMVDDCPEEIIDLNFEREASRTQYNVPRNVTRHWDHVKRELVDTLTSSQMDSYYAGTRSCPHRGWCMC